MLIIFKWWTRSTPRFKEFLLGSKRGFAAVNKDVRFACILDNGRLGIL